MRRTHGLVLAACTALALSACSFSASTASSVPAADVAEQTAQGIEKIVGQRPDVKCKDDLPAKVGATITCDLTDGTDIYDVKITVTTVEGTDVNFDFDVADTPRTA